MYENKTFEKIMSDYLNAIPDSYDKRESSFLYQAGAPLAAELAAAYVALDNVLNMTSYDTTDRNGKLSKCKERGIDITMFDATSSVVNVHTLPAEVNVPIGTRFSGNTVNFAITSKVAPGQYRAKCETAGEAGNVTGALTFIDYVEGLSTATVTSVYQYGADEASIEEIDEVFYASLESQAFGGNKADYKAKIKALDGVGGVKVIPVWNGGGTVKAIITTSQDTAPSADFVQGIQTIVDPQRDGQGDGFAPIGHVVTIAGAVGKEVTITCDVTLETGKTWPDIKADAEEALDNYFSEMNASWDSEDHLIIRTAKIEAILIDVPGILDVGNVNLNAVAGNLELETNEVGIRGDLYANS